MYASFARSRRPEGEGLTRDVLHLSSRPQEFHLFPWAVHLTGITGLTYDISGRPLLVCRLGPHPLLLSMPQRGSGQAAEPVASLMEIDGGGGEGAEAGVSRSAAAAAAAAEALPSPSPSPPSKRTRVAAPAAPQAQGLGQEQASSDRAPATTTATASMRGRSRAAVVSSRELMERVLAFVAGGSREAREDVGRAAVVCRVWREAAYGEQVWGRMASLGGGGGATVEGM
jgi:hypothetical protein